MKRTDVLNKRQVLAIPDLLKKKSIGGVAKKYGVSWQAIWYHIGKLRSRGITVITRPKGKKSKVYDSRKPPAERKK